MENFFTRYKNPLVLMAVLFIQVVMLATQVKRPENPRAANTGSSTRLIRVWTVTAFTPIEKMFVSTGHFFRNGWHNYADLRGIRKQNRELQEEVSRLQMEQVRLKQDADQARRLQALLEFKERSVTKTVAAQVIGTSGTEQSRVIYIDKGSRDGIRQDMAVITPDGIVGKIKDVFPLSSQVLLISDHDSGAGVILETTRLQGILKGTSLGELQVGEVMSDEKVEAGEHVITSGGDRIFPKGLPVGTVISAVTDRDNDPFLLIKIKPAADLRRLEEVMVVTKTTEDAPTVPPGTTPLRAADILSQRLPSIPKQDPNAPKTPGGAVANPGAGPDKTKTPAGAGAEPKKEPGATTGVVKPPLAQAEAAKSPTPAGKPAVGGAAAGTSANAGPDKKKPASKSPPPSTSTTGAATPTPTPKPNTALPKKKTPANPAGASGGQPGGNNPVQPAIAPSPTATPPANQEKLPR